jgi:hypothetical protein
MTALNAPYSSAQSGGPQRRLDDYGSFALIVGLVCAAGMLVGLLLGLHYTSLWVAFFRAYLTGYMLWLGLTLGCLALNMLHHLVGGGWGMLSRRITEAAIARLPLMALLFLPILLGVHSLFPWADHAQVAADPILQNKSVYLNTPFWTLRIAFYFLVWIILAARLRSLSHQQDAGTNPTAAKKMESLSAPGLLIFFLTVTFTAVDLIVSREPHWYSTVIGLLIAVGMGLSGLCFIVAMIALIVEEKLVVLQPHTQKLITSDAQPFSNFVSPARLNDLGNLMFTLVILWAYMALAQLLVIWMGNTSEDIAWYTQRGMDALRPNNWRWFGLGLVVFHFFVPFFLLLIKDNKRNLSFLGTLAVVILVLRQCDMVWLFAPTIIGPSGPESAIGNSASFMDILAPLAIGGLWFNGFVRSLESYPLIPPNDPQTADLLQHDAAHESHGGQAEANTQGTHGAADHTASHVTGGHVTGPEGSSHA